MAVETEPETLVRRAEAPLVTNEQLDLVRNTVAIGATDAELRLYLYDCARRGVHPLDRLIYFSKRGGRYTPITSIDYSARAPRKPAKWRDPTTRFSTRTPARRA